MHTAVPRLACFALLTASAAERTRAVSGSEQQAAFFGLIDFTNGALLERNPGLAATRDALLLAQPDYTLAETTLMASIPVAHYSSGPSQLPADSHEFAAEFSRRIDLNAPGLESTKALVESRWKFTFFPPTRHGLLFDLEADPHETRNFRDEPACAREKARLSLRLLEELAMSDRLDHTRIANA